MRRCRMPVAQVSNLLYRRFPIGRALSSLGVRELPDAPQVGNLRYSRLEICATSKKSVLRIARCRPAGRRLATPGAAPTPILGRFRQSCLDRVMDYVTTTPIVFLVVPNPVVERFGLPKGRPDTVQYPVGSGGGVLFPALQNLADRVIGDRPENRMHMVRHHHPGVEPVPLVNEEPNGSRNQLRQIRAPQHALADSFVQIPLY